MKIEKLEKDSAGRYNLEQIPDKINEIIDVLNSSFITDELDTAYQPYQPLTIEDVLNGRTVPTDITCDTLTPQSNEHTLNNFTIKGHVFDDMCAKTEPNAWSDKKCPHCGESYYTPGTSYTTAVYYPPIYKDGVNINPDRNKSTTTYHCCACGKDWTETN